MRAQTSLPARVLEVTVFGGLLAALVLTSVPYGTVEPWSQATFQIVIFLLGLLGAIRVMLSANRQLENLQVFYPFVALILFAILQSLSWSNSTVAGLQVQNAISADPFESWAFALRVSALTIAGALAVGLTTTHFRLSALVHTIILVAVISAIFGILRQAMQHDQGFLLPSLRYGGGFAQFINKNHFAYLVEAAVGLLVGIALLRQDRSNWLLVYLTAILLLWVALVMSRSRGGLLAVTVQAVCAVSLFILSTKRFRQVSDALDWKRTIAVAGATIILVLVVSIAGIIWLGGDQLTTGVETASFEMQATDITNEGARRKDFWRASWQMARAHPIAGAGLGGFWAEVPKFHQASGALTPHQAHNDYLELLASGGLIGAAIFVWFVVILIGKVRAIRNLFGFQRGAALGAVLGLLGIGVHSVVEFGLHITINALVFVMLLAILSIGAIDQRPGMQAHRTSAF